MKWCISSSADCSFCLSQETLLYVVAGSSTYLTRGQFTWRHVLIYSFLATSLQVLKDTVIYADRPDFKGPSIITGASYRPDSLFQLITVYSMCSGAISWLQIQLKEQYKSKERKMRGTKEHSLK